MSLPENSNDIRFSIAAVSYNDVVPIYSRQIIEVGGIVSIVQLNEMVQDSYFQHCLQL